MKISLLKLYYYVNVKCKNMDGNCGQFKMLYMSEDIMVKWF